MISYEIVPAVQYIHAQGNAWGAEFLCRVKVGDKIMPPSDLLEQVRRRNKEAYFDMSFIKMIMNWLSKNDIANGFINVHPNTFSTAGFAHEVVLLADHFNVRPERVVFEITEVSPFENWNIAVREIESLKERGFRFAIDDFGCGHSNIERLFKLYTIIDFVKIDDALYNDCSIVFNELAINYLPIDFKNRIIAERIEENETSLHLEKLGINLQQGYLHHKPAVLDLINIISV